MEGIELTAFSIISNVGMAKSLAIEALRDARKGKYNEAERKWLKHRNIL
ncbi:PTS lactose/cellobiose transporter subunit IIA [Enterococcus faecium]|nr:PTS lactose/cellobiose transporter subunit IIA [Enterococcus faecium]